MRRRLADNLNYFGEAVYEYSYLQGVRDGYLAPAKIEQWDLFHDRKTQPERVRGVLRADLKGKKLTNALTGQPVTADAVAERNEGAALEQKLILPERVEAMREYARLANLRYDNGYSGYIEVLDAERGLFAAELDYTVAKGQTYFAMVDIYKSMGGGWVIDAAAQSAQPGVDVTQEPKVFP